MAKKRNKVDQPIAPDPEHPNFEELDAIVVQRPHLWSGHRGVVVSVNGGQHLVRLVGKNGAEFHSYAPASELKLDL